MLKALSEPCKAPAIMPRAPAPNLGAVPSLLRLGFGRPEEAGGGSHGHSASQGGVLHRLGADLPVLQDLRQAKGGDG